MRLSRLSTLSRTYRHMGRYRQILSVLFKYGFGGVVDRLDVAQYLEIGLQMVSRKRRARLESLSHAERVRMALEELGPTFVKLGQVLSTRPDLVPMDFVDELSKLQDSVPAFPFAEARDIVEEELGLSLPGIFARFEECPIAAASIGQVHRAKLKSGEDVIVKVQRPDIRSRIEVDVEILLHLAALAEKHIEEMSIYRPGRIAEELARTLEAEVDYTVEAANQERFKRQFAGNPHIHVPGVYREALTERVLTMEYVDGIKASEVEKLQRAGLDRKIVASRGADLMLEQIFNHGFFHADPHPGNVFVMRDNVICYLDFGIMGHVDREAREHLVDMIYGYVSRDETAIANALLRLTEWDEEPERRALGREIRGIMDLHLYKPLKELRIKDLLKKTLELIVRHRLFLPPNIFFMVKGLTAAEGLGLMLDPDFDLAKKAAPFVARIKAERYEVRRVLDDIRRYGQEFLGLLRVMPVELRDILRQVKQGKMKIGFEHRGLEEFIYEMDRSSNRLAFAVVISSIIIGSSLIITTDMGPPLLGFPVLGLAGYTMAGILGIWLLISILRSGRF